MKLPSLSLSLTDRPAGQTLAEFGVTSGVFLLLLFAIMQMGFAVNTYNDMSTAAHEAARYAMVHSPTATNSPCPTGTGTQCTAVKNQAVHFAPFLSTTEVSATFTNPTKPASDYALVVITHAYPLHIPFTRSATINLRASSQMLVSQ